MCINSLFVQGKFIADYQGTTKYQFLVDKLLTSYKRGNSEYSGFLTPHD